ncbi:sugar phosphate isomerase/epimerase family protein [Yinghuangia soli]|uniref:Sugar phosphate isomerase/epimerase n=1 Tax=Yinghuangia soli TaxID=2908204 RepID=A0AA41Q402_9ACTN|nr:TIM barrel protein [Yinghuangia soli]MCF2531130.1 sugar phosphate isomerase/epimerase [Yinghuangia soli]
MTEASIPVWEPVLCSATLRSAGLPETARAAAAAGFSSISVYVSEYDQARAEGWRDEDLRGLLADLGLRVAEIDGPMAWLPEHTAVTAYRLHTPERFAEVAAALGARSLTVIDVAGIAVSDAPAAAARAFSRVCDIARDAGALAHIEPFGWSGIRDLGEAYEVVERAGHDNGGILLDTWHAQRGPDRHGLPTHVPTEAVFGIQVSGAAQIPARDLRREAVTARELPSSSDSRLVSLLADLSERGCTAPWGIEVFSTVLDGQEPTTTAHAAARALGELRAAIDGASPPRNR